MLVPRAPPNGLALKADGLHAANDPDGNVIDLRRISARLRQRLESFPPVAAGRRTADPDLLEFARSLQDATRGWHYHVEASFPTGSELDMVLRAYCAASSSCEGNAAEIFTCPDEPGSVTLRKLAQLIAKGTLERIVDPKNPRQFRVGLSKHAFDQFERWLRMARGII